MPSTKPHCSLNYHEFNGAELETQGHAVVTGIYDNDPPFTAPPHTKTAFEALVSSLHDTYEDYLNGGKNQKGAYMVSRVNLIKALDDTADFVEGLPGVDEAMITLAGFTPTKTGATQAVVPNAPVIESIKRGSKGVLMPSAKAQKGVTYFGCILLDKPLADGIVFIDGMFIITEDFKGEFRHIVTKGRKKTFTNLKTGTEYWFYFYGANSAGVSQLSVGVSEVCG